MTAPEGVAALTIEPSTWNIIGLDSNTPASGPNRFPVGAKLCGGTPGTTTTATLTWDSANPYIDLRAGSKGAPGDPITIEYGSDGCADAFFEVEVQKDPNAFDTTRQYHITAGGISTPTPRELKVERLVSQGRNAITQMEFGTSLAAMATVANGGSMDLVIGSTYYIRMTGYTATQGYEQLESFVNFPNTVFQILSVSTTYTADTSPIVSSPNDKLYADACGWDNDPLSPSYLSCSTDGKAGGTVVVTYQIRIVATVGSHESLNSLIHDFSGSSFHYNSDFSTTARFANIVDPTAVTISKNFAPDPNNVGGVSSLTFTLSNPNTGALGNVSFTDSFPAQPAAPGDMTLANTSTTNTCGGTVTDSAGGALNIGDTGIRLTGATVPASGSCSVVVNITTSSTGTYTNTTGDVFVDAIDTGKFATDTLTVNTDPPPGAGICGDPMASWTFLNGFDVNNPAPTTNNIGTATARPGTGTSPVGITPIAGTSRIADGTQSWGSNGNIDPTNGTLTTTQKDYFEFRLNTTGYTKAYIAFYARRTNNGPVGIAVFSSNQSDQVNPEPYAAIYNSATALSGGTGWTTFGTYEIPLRGNDTYVRIYAYDSTNANASSDVYIDDVVFTGCKLPTQPTIAKAFAPSSIASGGTATLTFTLNNPNAVALTGATFSDTLPAGMSVANPTGASTSNCGTPTWAPAAGATTLSFSGGTLPITGNPQCTVSVNVTAATGTYSNTSGFLSTTEGGQNKNSIATATLTALAPPTIAKNFAADPIFVNNIATLTFLVSNQNQNDALNGVAFTDTFPVAPGAMMVATPPNATSSGCGAPTFTPVAGAGSISFSNGTIAAGGTCTVTVDVTAPTAGTYSNTSGNVSHTLNGTWSGNTASDTLTVETPNPAIALLKQVAPASTGPWSSYLAVAAGSNVYYRFTVENLGDVTLQPFSVSDPGLPAPLSLTSCTWKDGDGNTLTAPLTLPVADADNGHLATCILGPATAAASGTYPNTATASGTYGGTTVTDTSTATYAISGLTLTKNADKSYFLAAGETINYSYVINNTGAAVLTGPLTVTVTDNQIAAVACPAVNTVGDLDIDFDPGESLTCTASYTVSASDVSDKQVVNVARARVSGVNIGTIFTPQTTRTVPLAPDLSVTKSNSVGGNAATSTPFNWTLTASNSAAAGTASFSNGQTLLTDNLPASGATYSAPAIATNLGGTSGTISCTFAANTLTCTATGAVSIPPAGAFSITVTTTPTAAGSLVNPNTGPPAGICRVDPGTVVAEINEANNNCSDTVTVTTPAVTLTKTADKPYFTAAGETITYTYKVRNTGTNILGAPAVITVADNKVAVTCPAVTTVGDLDTDFDTGEELTCTSVPAYTVLAADVTANLVTNTATATVTGAGPAVSSPQVSLTVPIGPDLSVAKSNDTGGTATINYPFNWTLTVTNSAGAGYPAIFADTQTLLIDNLPDSGATYNLPLTAATNIGTTTGTINCQVAASTLTCTASGAVSIPPGSAFSIAIPVTGTALGTLTNPKAGGSCSVDPTAPAPGLVAEINEGNNNCSDSVDVGRPLISISKVTSGGITNAQAGGTIAYIVTIENNGIVAGHNVALQDQLSNYMAFRLDTYGAGSPFSFTDSAPASGLTPNAPTYKDDAGNAYVPGASGYDGNIGSWRIPMTGTIRPGGKYIIRYEVKVE